MDGVKANANTIRKNYPEILDSLRSGNEKEILTSVKTLLGVQEVRWMDLFRKTSV